MGASVTILDIDPRRLRAMDTLFQGRATTMMADDYNIRALLGYADLVICAVLVHGARAPRLIDRGMIRDMKRGSVLVDVAIDQGGTAETSRPTTHGSPIYIEEGVVHYTVANMPGAVPRTATRALTVNTLPYVLSLAENGWQRAALQDKALKRGVNLVEGKVTYRAVADTFGLPFHSLDLLLQAGLRTAGN
jgi:alanine dehydrogenase